LAANTVYTGAKDAAGNAALASNYSWSFTTHMSIQKMGVTIAEQIIIKAWIAVGRLNN
jgi:hypothetical protein